MPARVGLFFDMGIRGRGRKGEVRIRLRQGFRRRFHGETMADKSADRGRGEKSERRCVPF
jgi:hypothetical protein